MTGTRREDDDPAVLRAYAGPVRNWSAWARAHPTAVDGWTAALLFVAFLISEPDAYGLWPRELPPYLELLACAPVALRRRAPLLAAAGVLAGAVGTHVVLALRPLVNPGQVAVFLVLYGLVVSGRRWAGAVLAVAFNLVVLTGLVAVGPLPTGWPELAVVSATLFHLLLTALLWALGEFIAARRAHLREVEDRLRRAESERDRRARLAVAEERNRIAREIHDVLAHSLSVMIAQADGASYALRTDPELAERAARTIGDTGRTALAELRGLLEVLRDPAEGGAWPPPPGSVSLRELVDRVRHPDLPVRLELSGDVEDLPTGLGLAVYRIAQEALTNVLKHGGGAAVVRVDNDGRAVGLEISDDGSASAAALAGTGSGEGNGLDGMRERAALYGGALTAGPRPEGGWRVHAVLPLVSSDAVAPN